MAQHIIVISISRQDTLTIIKIFQMDHANPIMLIQIKSNLCSYVKTSTIQQLFIGTGPWSFARGLMF